MCFIIFFFSIHLFFLSLTTTFSHYASIMNHPTEYFLERTQTFIFNALWCGMWRQSGQVQSSLGRTKERARYEGCPCLTWLHAVLWFLFLMCRMLICLCNNYELSFIVLVVCELIHFFSIILILRRDFKKGKIKKF